jgi:lipoprotein-anchoring transpeptidase ErfK/SrfK
MRRICMTALLVGAPLSPAFAQIAYYPSSQPVYMAQPQIAAPVQQYPQQRYYVYYAQPRYAAPAPVNYAVAPRGYAPAPVNYAAAPQAYAAASPAPQTYAAPVAQSYTQPAQSYAAPAPQPVAAPQAVAAAQAAPAQNHGGFLAAIFGGPTIDVPASRLYLSVPGAQTPQPQAQPVAPAQVASANPNDMSAYPIDPKYDRQVVAYDGEEKPGTIVIDTPNKFLYLVGDGGKAMRYGIGVGRPGFTWSGEHTITEMREWPDWRPPPEMIARQPGLPRYMPGGIGNPLGARAMYLGSTLYRIHGSNEPWTIGQNVSSGCIRMRNADVEDLYSRVKVGTKVVVM